MSRGVRRIVVYSLAFVVLAASACSAKDVTIDRILREHKVTVATTEPPDKLERYWLNWGYNVTNRLLLSDLLREKDKLPGDGDVLFVIDRSKCEKLDPAIEALLPIPLAALDKNEASVIVCKDAMRLNRKYANGWLILVIGPNDTWLHKELDRIDPRNSNRLKVAVSANTRNVLDKYLVRSLQVVCNDCQADIKKWLDGRFDPMNEAFDYEFADAQQWAPEQADTGRGLFLALNRDKLDKETIGKLCPFLHDEMQAWLRDSQTSAQLVCRRHAVKLPSGDERPTEVLVAPCGRLLSLYLSQHRNGLPEKDIVHYTDLSGFEEILVTAVSRERSLEKWLGDLASKMTSALAHQTGFRCASRQDLKSVVIERITQKQSGRLDPSTLSELDKRSPKDAALVVAELVAVDENTTFRPGEPICLTPKYPEFTEREPSKPDHPDPNARIIFKGRKYPQRENDPGYIRDHNRYHEELLPQYERDKAEWDRKKEEDEAKRRDHQMTWERTLLQNEQARIRVNVRWYDVRKSEIDRGAMVGRPLHAEGEGKLRTVRETDTVVVRGEDSRPPAIHVPDAKPRVSESVVSDGIKDVCANARTVMLQECVVPTDRATYVAPPPTAVATGIRQHVEVEEAESIVLPREPTGADRRKAQQDVLTKLVPKLLAGIKAQCPTANVTEEEVRAGATFVKDHWDPKLKKFRARFKFEGDVTPATKSEGGE